MFALRELQRFLAIAQRLGFRSTHLVAQLLLKWRADLKPTEWSLLSSFRGVLSKPNPADVFPLLFFSVNMEGFAGIWETVDSGYVEFL